MAQHPQTIPGANGMEGLNVMLKTVHCLMLLGVLVTSQKPQSLGSSAKQFEMDPNASYVPLEINSKVEVAGVSEPFLTLPVLCSSDDTIFVRMANTTGVNDLVGISSDGKSITQFSASKISDINSPTILKFFVTDQDVYLLAAGSVPEGKTVEVRRPDGEMEKRKAYAEKKFISHFKHDGTYVAAVFLDIPFAPLQIGAFPNGDFLIAGEIAQTHEPRVALVGSNGQFKRFVELQRDIRLEPSSPEIRRLEPDKPGYTSIPLVGKRFGEGFSDGVRISMMVPYGRNLLLVRKGQKSPVFSISPGGEVQTVDLEVPQGYSLAELKATRDIWVALYTHRISDTQGVEFQTYSLDPQTGKTIERYSYPKFLGLGLACVQGSPPEFSFLTRENDRLVKVKVSPGHANSLSPD
jgi:hypothetical protein